MLGGSVTSFRKLLIFFVLFGAFFAANFSYASDIPAAIDLSSHKSGDTTVDHYVYYRQQYSEDLNLEEVISKDAWITPEQGKVNHGFSDFAVWMKFVLFNSDVEEKKLVIEYVDANAEKIDIHYRTQGGARKFTHQNFTFNHPVSARAMAHYHPAFEVPIERGEKLEFYVKIFQGNDFPMHSFTSMRIWDEKHFHRASHKELVLLSALLFAELFMAFATLVAFLSTKDKIFLYYSCFVFSAAMLFSGLSGIYGYFISPYGYELWQVVFQISICQVAAILFVREFLKTYLHMPFLDMLLVGIVFIDVIGIIFNLLGSPYLSRIIIDYTAFAYLLLGPIGLYAHKKGVRHALLFTSSWILFIVGMALASLRLRGYINESFWSEWLIYIGGFVEIFLLTTVMILRIRDTQREKLEVELENQKLLQNSAEELSKKVEEQTQELKAAKQQAEEDARVDELTGLMNRRFFFEVAHSYISRAMRNKEGLYLLMIDIDHFKDVNDTYGHSAGDRVLKEISKVMEGTARNEERVSRIGGEEFAMLVEADSTEGVKDLAERLRREVEETETSFNGNVIQTTISIGISAWEEGDSMSDLMGCADKALYRAKANGRNRVEF